MPTKPTASTPEALRRRLATAMRSRRRVLGLTQAQAAELAEVTPAYWQRIEGRRANVTLAVMTRVAAALETTPAELFARR